MCFFFDRVFKQDCDRLVFLPAHVIWVGSRKAKRPNGSPQVPAKMATMKDVLIRRAISDCFSHLYVMRMDAIESCAELVSH